MIYSLLSQILSQTKCEAKDALLPYTQSLEEYYNDDAPEYVLDAIT